MKFLNYQQQVLLGFSIGIIATALASIIKFNFLANIGWTVSPILFMLNPIAPNNTKLSKKEKIIIQINSYLLILLILYIKFNLH